MPESHFIDYIKLQMRAGSGGAGSVHFRREKFVPKGGPDGGDGGRGGHIYLQGDPQRSTLLHLKSKKHIRADHGHPGQRQKMHGANGKDIILQVPLGTVAKAGDTSQVLLEITEPNEKKILLQGGQGGLGNCHFKTATQQVPRYAQPGVKRTEQSIILELKLIADIGLIGMPNAGKSTLLSTLSAARPAIADYPFTTLTPQLGIVSYQAQAFVLADIPGLIRGAAQGKGLGNRFLRHVARNKLLVIVIPAEADDYLAYYDTLRQELEQHDPQLMRKPHFIALSKIDLLSESELASRQAQLPQHIACLPLSAHAHTGIERLKQTMWQALSSLQESPYLSDTIT